MGVKNILGLEQYFLAKKTGQIWPGKMLPGEMTETQWIILSHDVNLVCLPNFSSLDYIGVVGIDGLLVVRRIEK